MSHKLPRKETIYKKYPSLFSWKNKKIDFPKEAICMKRHEKYKFVGCWICPESSEG